MGRVEARHSREDRGLARSGRWEGTWEMGGDMGGGERSPHEMPGLLGVVPAAFCPVHQPLPALQNPWPSPTCAWVQAAPPGH